MAQAVNRCLVQTKPTTATPTSTSVTSTTTSQAATSTTTTSVAPVATAAPNTNAMAQGLEAVSTTGRKRMTPSAEVSPAQAFLSVLRVHFAVRPATFGTFRGFMEDGLLPQNLTKTEWDFVVQMGGQLVSSIHSRHSIVPDAGRVAGQLDGTLKAKLEASMKTVFGPETKVWKNNLHNGEPVVVQVLLAIAYFFKSSVYTLNSRSNHNLLAKIRFKFNLNRFCFACKCDRPQSLCYTVVEIQCSGIMPPLRGWKCVAIKILTKNSEDPITIWTVSGKDDIATEIVETLTEEISNIWETKWHPNTHTSPPCSYHVPFERFLHGPVDAETLFSEIHGSRPENTDSCILHVHGLREPEARTPRHIEEALLNLMEIGKKVTLIISGSLVILSKYNLDPAIFENVLSPIVSHDVAFQLLYNIFDTTPGNSFFGREQDSILDQMRLVAAALQFFPILFLEFLSAMQRFSHHYPGCAPDLLDIILECWKQILQDTTEVTKSIGREYLSKLKEHLLSVLPEIDWRGLKSGGTFELPSSNALIEIGETLNAIEWSCFIPLPGNRVKVHVPFAVFAPFYDPEWQLGLDTDSWRHKMILMKPTKGFSFEDCVQHVQMDPGSPGFCALWELSHYHADPNSHKRMQTFTHLHEVSTSWMLVHKVLGSKNDVKTETTKEKVDSVSLGLRNERFPANPDSPDSIQNQLQLTCKAKGLELKCKQAWEEALKRKENAVYTFLSANQLVPTPTLLEYIRRNPAVTIDNMKFWKEFHIMSGPYLFCLYPEAFLHAIDPAFGQRLFDPKESHHPPIPKKSRT
ncbi:hypothetical protein Pelo_17280 [Pelomyxa schiedti]|nr:hypothetical protein Pelo_17280 [Pelomyxa schiedti]